MVEQVRTAVLDIAYEARGPADGRPVVLVHGFPDDARSWDRVAAELAGHGCRVIAPYLRGVGPTRFRDDSTPRSGQLGALVDDLVALLDALELPTATMAGQDWGSRAVQGVAALHPQRVEHLVTLGTYGLTWDDGEGFPPPRVLHALWYQWVLMLDQWVLMLDLGPALLRYARDEFCSYLWEAWSPTWPGRQEAFAHVRPSLENPDFTDVVLSAYRHGRGEAVTDPRYGDVDAALAAGPTIDVPTTILLGADDGVELPQAEDPRDARFFTHIRERRLLPGVGHFPHREDPATVAAALLR